MNLDLKGRSLRVSGPFASALTEVYKLDTPYEAVRSIARQTLEEANQNEPPFCPFQIASHLGIELRYEDMEDEGYCLAHDSNSLDHLRRDILQDEKVHEERPVIVLRRPAQDDKFSLRRRFTLAHEIGHLILRSRITEHQPHFAFDSDDREEEALCNAFASELLVPTPWILEDFRKSGVNAKSLVELSRFYYVSLQSILVKTIFLFGDLIAIGTYKNRDQHTTLSFVTPTKYRCLFEANQVHLSSSQALKTNQVVKETYELGESNSRRARWVLQAAPIYEGQDVMTIMLRHSLPEVVAEYFESRSSTTEEFTSLSAALLAYAKTSAEAAWRRSGSEAAPPR